MRGTFRNVPTQRNALIAVVLAAPFVLAGSVTTQAAASQAPTAVRIVSPIDTTGALSPTYKVTRHLGHGTCQAGSYQVGSAYRCSSPQAGANVLDPCWPLPTTPSTMVCQAKPWANEVIELHVVGSAAGGPSTRPSAMPWGLRIGADIRCLRDVGSVLRVDSHGLIYHCSQHRDIFGPLHASGALWRAHVYRTNARTASGEKSVGWLPVAIAWRGGAPVTASPTPTPTPSTPTPTPSTPAPTPTLTTTPTM